MKVVDFYNIIVLFESKMFPFHIPVDAEKLDSHKRDRLRCPMSSIGLSLIAKDDGLRLFLGMLISFPLFELIGAWFKYRPLSTKINIKLFTVF